MAKPKLKILSVGSTHSDWETAIGNRLKDQFEIQWVEKQSLSTEELALSLKNHDFSLIQGELSLQLKKIVVRRSVKSFFIDFIDFVYHQGGEIWGRSLFSEVVSKLLKTYIRDQD